MRVPARGRQGELTNCTLAVPWSQGQAEELLYFQSDSGSITCMPEEPGSDPSEPWQQAAGAGGGSEGDGLEQQEGEGWDWSDDPSWPEDDLVEGQRAA
jgi:hypothetical protein